MIPDILYTVILYVIPRRTRTSMASDKEGDGLLRDADEDRYCVM